MQSCSSRPEAAARPRAFRSAHAPALPAPAAGRSQRRASVAAAAAPRIAVADAQGTLTILVAEKLGKAGIDMLKAYGTVVEAFDMSQADLCAKVSLCDALIVRSATKARPAPAQRVFCERLASRGCLLSVRTCCAALAEASPAR